jgi:archaellum component FlaC
MPGLTLKSELILFKTRLQHLVSDIEWYYDLISYKQIIYKAQTLMRSHIDLIEDLVEEMQENLTEIQMKRAKILLEPFWGLEGIEHLINEAREKDKARENSAGNSAENL